MYEEELAELMKFVLAKEGYSVIDNKYFIYSERFCLGISEGASAGDNIVMFLSPSSDSKNKKIRYENDIGFMELYLIPKKQWTVAVLYVHYSIDNIQQAKEIVEKGKKEIYEW